MKPNYSNKSNEIEPSEAALAVFRFGGLLNRTRKRPITPIETLCFSLWPTSPIKGFSETLKVKRGTAIAWLRGSRRMPIEAYRRLQQVALERAKLTQSLAMREATSDEVYEGRFQHTSILDHVNSCASSPLGKRASQRAGVEATKL